MLIFMKAVAIMVAFKTRDLDTVCKRMASSNLCSHENVIYFLSSSDLYINATFMEINE